MKKIILLFALILMSCDWIFIPAPDLATGKVDIYSAWLSGRVVSLSGDNITKEDFIEYVESNYRLNSQGNKIYDYKTALRVVHSTDYVYNYTEIGLGNVLVFLQLSYNGKPIVYDEYPQGMPIMLNYIGRHIGGGPIIMTNGYVEFADSSYNGYTILPVAPNSVGADFDIRKVSMRLKYINENGNLRDFKEFFE